MEIVIVLLLVGNLVLSFLLWRDAQGQKEEIQQVLEEQAR